jgi:two-component system chemotaxis response regulator CheB
VLCRGIRALEVVLGHLSPDFPAAVTVFHHLDPHRHSLLAEILNRRAKLPVAEASHGDELLPGHIYLAAPNHHLLVTAGRTARLSNSELVHFVRPSADLLFESVTHAYGSRVIGVVLSGTGSDGSLGAQAIKERGEIVIVQDPATAEFNGMPTATIEACTVDFVLPLSEIAATIEILLTSE